MARTPTEERHWGSYGEHAPVFPEEMRPFTYKPLPPLNMAPLTPPKRRPEDAGGDWEEAPIDEFDAIDAAYDTFSPNTPVTFDAILDARDAAKAKTNIDLTINQITEAAKGRKLAEYAAMALAPTPFNVLDRMFNLNAFYTPSYEDMVNAFNVPEAVALLGAMEAGPSTPWFGARDMSGMEAGPGPMKGFDPGFGSGPDAGPGWGSAGYDGSSDPSPGYDGDLGIRDGGLVTLQDGGGLMKQDDRIDLGLPEQEPDPRSKYDLSNMTTAEWLLFHAPGYRVVGTAAGGSDSAPPQFNAALIPDDRDLPEASVGIQGAVEDSSVTGTASVGNKLLRYSKSVKKGAGPVEVMDTLEANLGPAHLYRKWGSGSSEMGAHGAIPVGPGSLTPFWKREQFESGSPRTSFGARGQHPVGSGMLSGGVERVARSTDHGPGVTSYRLGYDGKVGPGILGVQGSMADIGEVGRQTDLSGTYNWPDIFGLGGSGSVTGSYRVPPRLLKKYGKEDEHKVGVGWTKRF